MNVGDSRYFFGTLKKASKEEDCPELKFKEKTGEAQKASPVQNH